MLSARHAPRIVTRSMCSVVGMTLILLLWGARPANAHNTIINSSPRDGDVLVTTPLRGVSSLQKTYHCRPHPRKLFYPTEFDAGSKPHAMERRPVSSCSICQPRSPATSRHDGALWELTVM